VRVTSSLASLDAVRRLALAASGRERATYERQGDPKGEARGLCHMATTLVCAGRMDEARDHLAQAERRAEARDDILFSLQVEAAAMHVADYSDDFVALATRASKYLHLGRAIGDRGRQARALMYLGQAAYAQFDIRAARMYFERSSSMFRSLRHDNLSANVSTTESEPLTWLGCLPETLRRLERITSDWLEAEVLLKEGMFCQTAEVYRRLGNIAVVRQRAEAALECTRVSHSRMFRRSLAVLERIFADAGDHGRASGLFLEAANSFGTSPEQYGACNLAFLAVSLARIGDFHSAGRNISNVMERAETLAIEPQLVYWLLAQASRLVGAQTAATDSLKRAFAIFEERRARIPDEPTRSAFANLYFNREIVAARQENRWPGAIRGSELE
jgi:tetratricopeptide (TPR) repeat protein